MMTCKIDLDSILALQQFIVHTFLYELQLFWQAFMFLVKERKIKEKKSYIFTSLKFVKFSLKIYTHPSPLVFYFLLVMFSAALQNLVVACDLIF